MVSVLVGGGGGAGEQPLGALGDGEVDELAAGQTECVASSRVERGDDLVCPFEFVAGGREHGVQDRQLSGVDGRLAGESERAGELGLVA